MVKPYSELSSNAQNAYADLFDSIVSINLNSMISLNGSFGKKVIRDKDYWYFQFRDIDRKVKQIYVGPDSDKLKSLINQQQTSSVSVKPIRAMAEAAVVLGCDAILNKHFRVIRRLSEYGFFKHGGILVGTHAYLTMCNMLGIYSSENMQTQDVDFAHAGKNISIAMPSNINVKTVDAIDSLEMGLIPITNTDGKFGATYLNPSDPAFRIDFLTSKNSIEDNPVYIPGLNVSLQPLKFMEFSMIDTLQSAIFCNEGAVLVNIPKPDRFAIHKLIVSQERKQSETAKINKDVRQANVLIQYYLDHRHDELIETCLEAIGRGSGWKKRLIGGLDALSKINPSAVEDILESIKVSNAPG